MVLIEVPNNQLVIVLNAQFYTKFLFVSIVIIYLSARYTLCTIYGGRKICVIYEHNSIKHFPKYTLGKYKLREDSGEQGFLDKTSWQLGQRL